MSRRPYRGISDSQANADALARRAAPYSAASEVSFRLKWNFHLREPADLRDAVRMVRRAYSDEVPAKLHEGPDSIGPDGTPKMTTRAEGYIFGSAQGSDRTDPDQIASYYHSPFRAALDTLKGSHDTHPQGYVCDNSEHKRGLIVQHVTIGSQGAQEAAIAEGVPLWCAKLVAEDAIRSFLRSMTDLKLHLRRREEAVA